MRPAPARRDRRDSDVAQAVAVQRPAGRRKRSSGPTTVGASMQPRVVADCGLLNHALSGSGGMVASVTALVLAASGCPASGTGSVEGDRPRPRAQAAQHPRGRARPRPPRRRRLAKGRHGGDLDRDPPRDHRQAQAHPPVNQPVRVDGAHEAPCERRERTNNSHPCRLEDRPRADAAARRSWGQSRRGIARWRREQPRQRSGRAALPDARVRASKTERQSESKAVVEAS